MQYRITASRHSKPARQGGTHSRTNLRWRKRSFAIEARFAICRGVAPGTFARGCGGGATEHSRARGREPTKGEAGAQALQANPVGGSGGVHTHTHTCITVITLVIIVETQTHTQTHIHKHADVRRANVRSVGSLLRGAWGIGLNPSAPRLYEQRQGGGS